MITFPQRQLETQLSLELIPFI